jgi:PAS domain S-box-containing protein
VWGRSTTAHQGKADLLGLCALKGRGVHFEDFGLRAFFCLCLPGGFTVTRSESESQYRDCFENPKYAIYVHDLNGRYTMVNKAGEALIGYSREEILQMTISDIVPESCRDQIQASMKKLADNIPAIYEIEAIRKDGSRVPVEVSSCLIYELDQWEHPSREQAGNRS